MQQEQEAGGRIMDGKIILIVGGARSGKSRLAEEMAMQAGGTVAYIATANVYDDEMAERVRTHQSRRPAGWLTVEEPLLLTSALERVPLTTNTVIMDCLTLWLTNLLLQRFDDSASPAEHRQWDEEILAQVAELCSRLHEASFCTIIVSNEVGSGLVPEHPLGRVFRDIAGRANQLVAAQADRVYLAVAGLSLCVKGGT
jgi:adenosylcobinamide kinase/adenosylcobinamide-phosphate guanylyltransferase